MSIGGSVPKFPYELAIKTSRSSMYKYNVYFYTDYEGGDTLTIKLNMGLDLVTVPDATNTIVYIKGIGNYKVMTDYFKASPEKATLYINEVGYADVIFASLPIIRSIYDMANVILSMKCQLHLKFGNFNQFEDPEMVLAAKALLSLRYV